MKAGRNIDESHKWQVSWGEDGLDKFMMQQITDPSAPEEAGNGNERNQLDRLIGYGELKTAGVSTYRSQES